MPTQRYEFLIVSDETTTGFAYLCIYNRTTKDAMDERYCIIMAGGIGSRFWPLSKDTCPKQFIDILGTGRSFIRATFERLLPLVPANHFLVVTNASYRELVLQHLPELSPDQVLCEPMRRNTAPCIAYASWHIRSRCRDAQIIVTPADHIVTNEWAFQQTLSSGLQFLSSPDHRHALLTIGIKPSRPETGYGYIEVPVSDNEAVLPVVRFKEKPNHQQAEAFLSAGNFLWNSGIFLWNLSGIEGALRRHLPELSNIMDEGASRFGTAEEQDFIDAAFPRCPNISIDYGVLEPATDRYVIPADFGWSDVGTWGSLFTLTKHDDNDNALIGRVLTQDCHHSVVNIEEGVEAIVQGLDNYLVAYRGDALLICRMHDEQHIKEWVEQLHSSTN